MSSSAPLWKAKTLNTHFTLLFSPWGRDNQAVLFSTCCYHVASAAATSHSALSVLSSPQPSRECWVLHALQSKRSRKQFLVQPFKKLECRTHTLIIYLPWNNLGVGGFSHSFHAGLVAGTMARKRVFVQTIAFVIDDPQPGALFCQCLDAGKKETSFFGRYPKILNNGHMFLSFLFFPKGEFRSWNFPLSPTVIRWGKDCGERVQ